MNHQIIDGSWHSYRDIFQRELTAAPLRGSGIFGGLKRKFEFLGA